MLDLTLTVAAWPDVPLTDPRHYALFDKMILDPQQITAWNDALLDAFEKQHPDADLDDYIDLQMEYCRAVGCAVIRAVPDPEIPRDFIRSFLGAMVAAFIERARVGGRAA